MCYNARVMNHKKTDSKRELILSRARELFAAQGFRSVTMKDVAQACGISRGGLYLYYGSTEGIFLDVLRTEGSEQDNGFAEQLGRSGSAAQMLGLVLEEQKKELLEGSGLMRASYEFSFSGSTQGREILAERFRSAVQVLEYLIRLGCRNGEFACRAPEDKALEIMLVIEGLRIGVQAMEITEDIIDTQFRNIMQSLYSNHNTKQTDGRMR